MKKLNIYLMDKNQKAMCYVLYNFYTPLGLIFTFI